MGDTTPKRKFMFDQSFDHMVGAGAQRADKPVLLKPEQIELIKREAYELGIATGMKAAAEDEAARQTSLLERIEQHMAEALALAAGFHEEQTASTRSVVMAIARKILPDFVTRHGVDEISAMLNTAIGEMLHEPRLVVRTNELQFDTIKAKIDEIVARKAYSGKVVVLADAEVAQGDCRVEWADGGIERKTATTWQKIDTLVSPAPTSPPQE